MALISLTEWAKREGITDRAARQKASEGRLKTAQKIARNWVIDESEQNADYRRREMTKREIASLLADMTDAEMYESDQYPQITHMAGTSREGDEGVIYFLVEVDGEEIIYEEVTIDASAEDYGWAQDTEALTELYQQVRDAAQAILDYLSDCKSWTIGDDVTVVEIEHDYDLHAFEVYHEDELISTIYPDTITDADGVAEALDAGESPIGWEDGMGGTVTIPR